jgi:hypothetical protein
MVRSAMTSVVNPPPLLPTTLLPKKTVLEGFYLAAQIPGERPHV